MTANAPKVGRDIGQFWSKGKGDAIHRGPAVTRYEVQPDTEVKVSRIVNLSDDLRWRWLLRIFGLKRLFLAKQLLRWCPMQRLHWWRTDDVWKAPLVMKLPPN